MAKRKGVRALSTVFGLCLLGTVATAGASTSSQEIEQRIKPIGKVFVKGSETKPIAAAVAAGPRSGEAVHNTFCTACHSTGVTGAPITGNAEQWGPRKAKGMEVLMEHALNGFNAMPAKGTCMDCSDDEIQAAIEHMLKGV